MSDLISRETATHYLTKARLLGDSRPMKEIFAEIPSVEPERKPGKWIDGKCNKCGTHAPFWAMSTTYYCSDYCPKCGAKMEVNG